MTTCGLCLTVETPNPYRAAGLDVCDFCWGGSLTDAAEAWGLTIDAKHWTEWIKSGDSRTLVHRSEVRIALATSCSVPATFTSEHPSPRWMRWFDLGGNDPQIGYPLFDDHVLIDSVHDVQALLADEGLQTGIMSALGNWGSGRVVLSERELFVRISGSGSNLDVMHAEVNAVVMAIAVQVERFSRGLR